MTLSLTIQDTSGCLYTDELRITVLEREEIYVPNVFSPNGDGINDEIFVVTNLPEDRLISFEIFDRWGGLLHGQYNQGPFKWDGTSKDEAVQNAVFVYKLIWLDDQGYTKVKTGDITLIR